MKKWGVVAGLACVAMTVGACSSGGGGSNNTTDTNGASTSSTAGSNANPSSADAGNGNGPKVAMLLSGPINDNDWNFVGYHALQQVKDKENAQVAYNESVAVANATQQARQFVSNGYQIVAFQGSEFLNSAQDIAKSNSDVTVIGQDATGALPNQPKNLWIMQLKFYPGEYVLGYAAGLVSKGSKACFISGLSVPSTVGAGNAALRGMKAANPSIQVAYTFTGSFDDASKARQSAAAMINEGCGSFVVHLNGAVPGVVQAIKDSGKNIPWFGLYTDKHDMDTTNYVGGYMFDFDKAYTEIVSKVQSGTRTGVYDLGEGIEMTQLYNISDDQKSKIKKVFDDVSNGTTQVPNITDKIQVPS